LVPCIEVYITDECSGENQWVLAEPVSRVISSDGYEYLSVEYEFDGEHYTEDFGPERVRRRGELESVLELYEEEVTDVTSTEDIQGSSVSTSTYRIGFDKAVDKQGTVLQSVESKRAGRIKNAWQATGHWVCEHGVFLLAHQECRCLQDEKGKDECNVLALANPAAQRRSSEENKQSALRHERSHLAVAKDLTERTSAHVIHQINQEPVDEHLREHGARKINQEDHHFTRDSARAQEKVVAAASAWSASFFRLALRQVQLILPGLPEHELYLPTKDPDLVSLNSSIRADVPIGDEAV
jgi:hypothetical protein